jgi:hemolysin activation/secretion protein
VALQVTGESQSSAINYSQPVYASDSWLVLANYAQTFSMSESRFTDFVVTNDHATKETAGVSVTQSGNEYSITLAPNSNFVQHRSLVTDVNRELTIFTSTWNALARLPGNFSISILGSGQYTWNVLLPGDQLFQIGGPTTVRGFPTNAVAGDSGQYTNFELHNNLTTYVPGLDVYGFVDRGDVWSTFPHHTILRSAGAGMSWTPWAPITFESSAGFPWQQVVPNQHRYEAYFRVSVRPLLLAAAAATKQ